MGNKPSNGLPAFPGCPPPLGYSNFPNYSGYSGYPPNYPANYGYSPYSPPSLFLPPLSYPTASPVLTFVESYFFISIVCTLLILFILWHKNPRWMQQSSDDPLVQQPPSVAKLLLIGVLTLSIFSVGPSLSKWNLL
jgi:hypothetical protein